MLSLFNVMSFHSAPPPRSPKTLLHQGQDLEGGTGQFRAIRGMWGKRGWNAQVIQKFPPMYIQFFSSVHEIWGKGNWNRQVGDIDCSTHL